MKVILSILFCLIVRAGLCQDKNSQKEYKTACQEQLNKVVSIFRDYSKNAPKNGRRPIDSVLANYLVFQRSSTDTSAATGEDHYDRAKYYHRQVTAMQDWIMRRDSTESFSLRNIDSTGDKDIFSRLKPFDQNNSFAVFSEKNPKETLFYILFIPDKLFHTQSPLILSWTLCLNPGFTYFIDFGGNLGTEVWFDL